MWLTLPLNSAPAQTRLHFEAAAYYRERTVAVLLNGQEVAQLKVSPEKQSYNLSLEAKWLKPGDNLITLRPLEPADIPAEREQTRDIRTLTIVLTNLGVSPD